VKPIVFRCQNAVVVFIPVRFPRHNSWGVICANDNTRILAKGFTTASMRTILTNMAQKATALGGTVQQIVQLDL